MESGVSLAYTSKRRGGGTHMEAHFHRNSYMHEQTTIGFGIRIGGGST